MNYRHQAMRQKIFVVSAFLGIWILSGLSSVVRAQSVTTHTSNMLSKSGADLLKRGKINLNTKTTGVQFSTLTRQFCKIPTMLTSISTGVLFCMSLETS